MSAPVVIEVSPPRGYSAYEIAVQQGYQGTIEEWNDAVNAARVAAEAARDDSVAARDTAVAASDTAVSSMDTAVQARNEAVIARDTSVQSAEAAQQSELAAQQSAAAAEEDRQYLETELFHYIQDDAISVTVGLGTQVLVSESTTGYPSVILQVGV